MAREREIRVSCAGPSSTTRRDHWNQQVGPEETGDRRGEASFQLDGGGTRRELDLVQDEVDEAKRLLEEAHVEVQAAQNKVTEAAFWVGQAMEEMARIKKLVGGELGTSLSMRTGQKKRLLGGIKRTKAMWERWYEAILEEEKPQGSKDITVQCVDFCEAVTSKVHAVLQHAPFDLRGGTVPATPTCSGGNC